MERPWGTAPILSSTFGGSTSSSESPAAFAWNFRPTESKIRCVNEFENEVIHEENKTERWSGVPWSAKRKRRESRRRTEATVHFLIAVRTHTMLLVASTSEEEIRLVWIGFASAFRWFIYIWLSYRFPRVCYGELHCYQDLRSASVDNLTVSNPSSDAWHYSIGSLCSFDVEFASSEGDGPTRRLQSASPPLPFRKC